MEPQSQNALSIWPNVGNSTINSKLRVPKLLNTSLRKEPLDFATPAVERQQSASDSPSIISMADAAKHPVDLTYDTHDSSNPYQSQFQSEKRAHGTRTPSRSKWRMRIDIDSFDFDNNDRGRLTTYPLPCTTLSSGPGQALVHRFPAPASQAVPTYNRMARCKTPLRTKEQLRTQLNAFISPS